MPAKPRRPLASTKEVADYLQKPEKTLRNWRSQGEGPHYTTVGRDVRYDWDDVDAWLRTKRHDMSPKTAA